MPPFHAKKGLRQGDPLSPFLFVLAMEYLTRILKDLIHQPQFLFHPRCKKLQVIQLGFADDLLLFCKGELQSVQLLFQSFQRFSSSSGLVANIDKSSIYFGGEFWSQAFVLPKIMIELVKSTCRTFLWTGDVSGSNKTLIAWERLCLLRVAGGLNILDIYTWNQAAIRKMLWNICRKKDTLWVKWIHTYYVKTGEIWNTKVAKVSWMVKKILKATWLFDQTGCSENMMAGMESYSIKWFYKALRGDYPKVVWRRLLCNNSGLPKWLFILYLALNRRLQTKDRIACWANLDDPM
ncbi:uncharacterized protein LOC132608897 [Lycium barbarum]|uniref:uncharacterized protein LOC132608897 n=1 Tax=Lycium barbarum TaxID=112863 RepID=UPI00293F5E7C|nr:uncharacterized protein LOC132608897 [Lycium barbarum]